MKALSNILKNFDEQCEDKKADMTREEKSSCFFLKGICICMDTCTEHWNLKESKNSKSWSKTIYASCSLVSKTEVKTPFMSISDSP